MSIPPIEGVATADTAFVAPAPKGPLNAPVAIESVRAFAESFGEVEAAGALGTAVRLFFENGGERAYVMRVNASTPPAIGDYGNATAGSGIYALDAIAVVNLLCLPAVAADPALFALLPTAAAYCEKRQAILLVEPPPGATVAEVEHWAATVGARIRSRNVAAYYPALLIANGTGTTAAVSCCGAIAGAFARHDASRGVWRAPAGADAAIVGAAGLAHDPTEEEAARLAALGINALRHLPGPSLAIWGARMLVAADGGNNEYTYVNVRRLALYIEQSIQEGTRWAVFEPNGPALWQMIREGVTVFLSQLFREGAFAGTTPQQTYSVRCDHTTMSQADIDAGRLNIVVGFAAVRPAEFVIITIGQFISRKCS